MRVRSRPWPTNHDRSRSSGATEQTKHYGIATHGPLPSPELAEADRALAEPGVPGFTIAHEGKAAAMALVYWWAEENELHRRAYAAPLRWATPASCSR